MFSYDNGDWNILWSHVHSSSAGVQIMMATVPCGCEGVQVVTLSDTLGLHLQI